MRIDYSIYSAANIGELQYIYLIDIEHEDRYYRDFAYYRTNHDRTIRKPYKPRKKYKGIGTRNFKKDRR